MKVRRAKSKSGTTRLVLDPPITAPGCTCPPSIKNEHLAACPFADWAERERAKLSPPMRAFIERLEAKELTRVGSATVQAVPFEGVAPLVTLDDPSAPPEAARGAFARLRPPDDHPPGETASWAGLVRAQAIAARVVPRTRRREVLLPNEARPTPAADVRAEATALAAATNDPEVVALVESIMSEVEGRT